MAGIEVASGELMRTTTKSGIVNTLTVDRPEKPEFTVSGAPATIFRHPNGDVVFSNDGTGASTLTTPRFTVTIRAGVALMFREARQVIDFYDEGIDDPSLWDDDGWHGIR